MADQFTPIQIQQLGLLAMAGGPYGAPVLPGLLAGATPQTRPAAAPKSDQKPFAGLFNMQGGYTPADIQKSLGDVAGHFQGRPTIPMWNGNRGVGNWLPTAGNFAQGALGMLPMYLQQQNTRENERIRREAVDRASGATTLEDFVSAFRGGTPEQSNVAMQAHLQNLIKEQERARQAAIMQQVYGGPPEAAAPAATAPAAPTAPTAPTPAPVPAPITPPALSPPVANNAAAAPPAPASTTLPFPTDRPPGAPAASAPPAALPNPGTDFMMPPSGGEAVPQTPQHILTIDGMNPQQIDRRLARENALTRPGVAPAAAPAPQAAPAQLPQDDPTVQIGQFRLPLSEARRRAALGRAQGIDVKPLEDAINLAEEPLKAAARKRGEALGEAQTGLPQSIQAAESTIAKIDEITNDPQLERVIGWSAYNPGSYLPYTPEQRGLVARIQQVQGRFFLQAFDALRGGGQITEKEGQKAQEAIARIMDLNQDMGSYRTALEDARREVWSLTNIARTRAGLAPAPYQPAPPSVGSVRDGYRFNGGNPADPSSWQRVR